MAIGPGELVFLLVIVLIVFGAGKLPDVLGQLGRGVRTFREESSSDKPASPAASSGGSTTTLPGLGWACENCGRVNATAAKFCPNCGTAR